MIIICHQVVNISITEFRVMGSVIWKIINVFVGGILIKWISSSSVKCVLIFVELCRMRLYLVTCLACVSITDKFNFIMFRLCAFFLPVYFFDFDAQMTDHIQYCGTYISLLTYFSSKYIMVIQKHQNERVIKIKKLRRIEFKSRTS